MLVHRLSKQKYAHDLSGSGARRFGGRWNLPGTALLYTSEHRSLAVLEVLVHMNVSEATMQFIFTSLDVGESVKTLSINELPIGWQNASDNYLLIEIAESWIYRQQTIALRVPSVIIPEEFNVLLNPEHPKFSNSVKIVEQQDFSFDKRLFFV